MSPQRFERLTLTELRFPSMHPPGALHPTDRNTSAVYGIITAGAATCLAAEVQEDFDKLQSVGVDLGDVLLVLDSHGVENFSASWDELMKAAQTELDVVAETQQSGSAGKFGRQSR